MNNHTQSLTILQHSAVLGLNSHTSICKIKNTLYEDGTRSFKFSDLAKVKSIKERGVTEKDIRKMYKISKKDLNKRLEIFGKKLTEKATVGAAKRVKNQKAKQVMFRPKNNPESFRKLSDDIDRLSAAAKPHNVDQSDKIELSLSSDQVAKLINILL